MKIVHSFVSLVTIFYLQQMFFFISSVFFFKIIDFPRRSFVRRPCGCRPPHFPSNTRKYVRIPIFGGYIIIYRVGFCQFVVGSLVFLYAWWMLVVVVVHFLPCNRKTFSSNYYWCNKTRKSGLVTTRRGGRRGWNPMQCRKFQKTSIL